MSASLIKYDAMCRAIDVCHRVDEVAQIRNQAAALKEYARISQNRDAERQAAEIRVRAERKAGELIKAMDKAKAGRPKIGGTPAPISSKKAKLADVGFTKEQASRCERLADMPQKQFDEAMEQLGMPSANGVLAASQPPKPVSDRAIEFWDWLRKFDLKFASDDPAERLRTMSPEMLDFIHITAPRAAAWLKQIGAADVGASTIEQPDGPSAEDDSEA